MRLLAIDSATERLALAAISGDAASPAAARVGLRDLAGGPASSAQALPGLQALADEAGWPLGAVQAVAFGQGPGGFTGLRTACAVAQGLAWGLDVPVLAIDSLMLVADDAAAQQAAPLPAGACVQVAMDARMDEIYAAAYTRQADGSWQVAQAPRLTTPAALAADWAALPPQLVAGSALAAFAGRLPVPDQVPAVAAEASRAAALARLATRAFLAGQGLPAAQALPLYLRDKVAQTTAEREAAKALKLAAANAADTASGTPSVGTGAGSRMPAPPPAGSAP